MEQTIHSPETYDFRKYDQIWQRVAPNLEPYPDLREPAVPAVPPLPSGGTASGAPAVPAAETLPGAEQDPCCMGTAAREELAEAKHALSRLGLQVEKIQEFPMGDTSHGVIVLKKVKPTPPQYPRRYAKIKQSPL